MSHGMSKIAAERHQRALLDLANLPGNDACADCKARTPRWASHNLGIFICVNCASIHRKMGTHISKVKSITLDSWSKEQIDVMRQMGNIKSNAFYNPNETRHPPPTNMVDSERDSDLEKYIRSKYEFKSFVDKSAQVAAVLGPPRSASSRLSPIPPRSQTTPAPRVSSPSVPPAPPPKQPPPPALPLSTSTASALPSSITQFQLRSASLPVSSASASYNQVQPQSSTQPSTMTNWNDLASLQSSNNSFALQYAPPLPTSASQPIAMSTQATPSHLSVTANPHNGLFASPISPYPSSMNQMTSASTVAPGSSMSFNAGMTLNTGTGFPQSINAGRQSPFPPLQPSFGAPSPQPFAPQSLPAGQGMAYGQPQQPATPFSASPFQMQNAGASYPQPQGSPMFQQSMNLPQMQLQTGNPFLQQQQVHTPFGAQSQYDMGSLSPFGQPQQQQQQQQQQQSQFTPTPGSVFSGWQHGQQPGFPGQQWG